MKALEILVKCLLAPCRYLCCRFLRIFSKQSKGIGILAVFILVYSTFSILLYSQSSLHKNVADLWSLSDPFAKAGEGFGQTTGGANNNNNNNKANEPPLHWKLSQSSPEDVSACLLVMDDNHYLIEWLAYHYHTANLRNLIIVSDDKSMTSPRKVLERWKGRMDILMWKDEHYFTSKEFEEAQEQVVNYFGTDMSQSLILHRARQRLFYFKCLQNFQQRGKSWVLLTDTDEFVRVNYDAARSSNVATVPIEQPGSISTLLQQHAIISNSPTSVKDNVPLYTLQSSPCVQVPRLRFAGGKETKTMIVVEGTDGDGFNSSTFLTQRWTTHASPTDYKKNKISKAIVDVSRIAPKDLLPVDSIHLPVRAVCEQRRLHLRVPQSLLVIHHYLGDLEQYRYRENDSRNNRSVQDYSSSKNIQNPETSTEIQPWLGGFMKNMKNNDAKDLLDGVGQLEPKSWYTYNGPPKEDRCAFCFFGLPRAYKNMVLPSIVRNLLIPNARHNCDIYVHYYKQFEEVSGRRNRGGKINPDDIFLLEPEVKRIAAKYGPKDGRNANRVPNVAFTYDTDDMFWEKRKDLLAKYHNTTRPDGKPAYFPWATKTYTHASLDNMVRQWHSIEFAYKLLDYHAKQLGVTYSRVGMFRNDAMYVTPIDIAVMDRGQYDTQNKHVVLAAFAQFPINDRMIYGPYDAVKIWSTKRFELIEKRVQLAKDPGFEMHSERFLNSTVFPVIRELGVETVVNRDICFVRTRADEAALANDCLIGGMSRGFGRVNKKAMVENIVGKKCTEYWMGFKWIGVGCGEGITYHDGMD
eukprot:scaffold823_cov86-Cylindrotheca_fusiformis.AAC.5